MEFLALLPTIIQAASSIKGLIDMAVSHTDLITKIKAEFSGIAGLMEQYGAQFFPKVAPELHIAAAAMTAFDPNVTKWVQGCLNSWNVPSPNLVVDGHYGPKTKAAVEVFQTAHGLAVDGWAGQATQS